MIEVKIKTIKPKAIKAPMMEASRYFQKFFIREKGLIK